MGGSWSVLIRRRCFSSNKGSSADDQTPDRLSPNSQPCRRPPLCAPAVSASPSHAAGHPKAAGIAGEGEDEAGKATRQSAPTSSNNRLPPAVLLQGLASQMGGGRAATSEMAAQAVPEPGCLLKAWRQPGANPYPLHAPAAALPQQCRSLINSPRSSRSLNELTPQQRPPPTPASTAGSSRSNPAAAAAPPSTVSFRFVRKTTLPSVIITVCNW